MKEEIDAVLARLKGSIVQTRSEFLRMAAAYSLASSREKPPTRSALRKKNDSSDVLAWLSAVAALEPKHILRFCRSQLAGAVST
jgi:hypothetical protein